jgi:guanylate kinase
MTNNQQPITNNAALIVVSGPSGVGKTTVVERLIEGAHGRLRRAITATTRKPRPHEQDARDYHFWSEDEFRTAIDEKLMLEWAVVFEQDFYGTPRSEVDPYLARGVGVLLVIDVQGAAAVRNTGIEHLSVFIEPPSMEVLEARLRGRGDTDEARVQRRLATARDELARAGEFDHRIVNRDLPVAVSELGCLVFSV